MISVTALPGYLYCKRKLYLNYVLGIREPINVALVRGKIRHLAHESISKREEWMIKNITEKEFERILEFYNKEHEKMLRDIIIKNSSFIDSVDLNKHALFSETLGFILDESAARAKFIAELIEKEGVLGEELWLRVVPKTKSEFRIESKAIGLKGIIDRIDVYPDKIIPVELKTGKAPAQGFWDGHKIQIGAYCLLAEDYFKAPVKEGRISYLDSREEREVVMNPFLKSDILSLVEQAKCLFNSKELPAIEKNQNKCKNCGLREQCFDEKLLKNRAKELFTSPQ